MSNREWGKSEDGIFPALLCPQCHKAMICTGSYSNGDSFEGIAKFAITQSHSFGMIALSVIRAEEAGHRHSTSKWNGVLNGVTTAAVPEDCTRKH